MTFVSPAAAVRAGYRAHTDCNPGAALLGLPTTGRPDSWRKQPEQEPLLLLRRIIVGARVFFADAADSAGKSLRRFPSARGDGAPTDSGWRPRRPCCEQPGKICPPGKWRGGGWRELEMLVSWPHRFQYRVTTRGRGRHARITAEARGDPACDGRVVRYRMSITLDRQLRPKMRPCRRWPSTR